MPKDLPLTDSSYESSVSPPNRRSIVNKTQTEQIKSKKEKKEKSDSQFESETIQSTDSDQKSLQKKSKKKKQRRFDPMPEEIKIDRKVTKTLNSDLPPSPKHVKNKNSLSNFKSSPNDQASPGLRNTQDKHFIKPVQTETIDE